MFEALRSVLLAESNQQDREELAGMIRKEIDCVVYEAGNSAEALNILANETVCVLVIGILHPDQDETNLLKTVLRQYSQVLVIPVVPLGNQDAIVAALKIGCFTYLNHPYHITEGVIAVSRALYFYDLLIHQEKRGQKIRKTDGFYGMIGESPKMRVVYQLIEKIAEDGLSTVLIQGESGTGKELVARAIHAHSQRRLKNFVPVNCAAIPEDLLENELFGHHKGAFTGAIQSKIGRIQYAEGGTLFLDEIGDMSPSLQAKLLRVVQEKSFVPIGGLEQVPVDVRIIAATHRDLEAMVAEGDFREDLFYRLSVVPLSLPPLRERREDIPLLVEKFVQIFNRNRPNRLQEIKPAALAALVEYPWPGNVRELENLVQRLVVLHGGGSIGVAELPDKYSPSRQSFSAPDTQATTAVLPHLFGPEGVDFDALVQDFEDHLILRALRLSSGNRKEAARLLRLNRTTLLAKMNKKGLQ